MTLQQIKPAPYQERVLEIPENVSVMLDGGRGSGKTHGLELNAVRHCEMHGDRAHALFVREHLRALSEVEDAMGALCSASYGGRVKINRTEHTIRLPGGGIIEFAPLSCADDYAKLQGRSFSLINCDEAGSLATLKWLMMLQSNLRAGSDVPTRQMLAANPAGRQHSTIHQRWIAKAPPWTIFEIDGVQWVRAPGTWRDNPHLPPDYMKRLLAAAGKDRALFDAWANGSWNVLRGSMFADVLSEEKQMIAADNPGFDPRAREVSKFIACDWGQSSPSVAFAVAKIKAPTGKYPRGSVILLDEVTSADPDDLSVGLNWSPGRLADSIKAMTDRVFGEARGREGCIDDARGLSPDETLIKFMRTQQLYLQRPVKGRREGWAAMRELLTNSRERNGRPGLWVSERCSGFWATVPSMPRDERIPEDVDTKSIDHWGDAARYAVTHNPPLVGSIPWPPRGNGNY